MAKKVKSDSLVSAITVDTPKVTDLNISRADLISYVTAETQKQYEVLANNLHVELAQAVAKYLDREIARVNYIILCFNKEAATKNMPEFDLIRNHKRLIDQCSYGNIFKLAYDDNSIIKKVYSIDSEIAPHYKYNGNLGRSLFSPLSVNSSKQNKIFLNPNMKDGPAIIEDHTIAIKVPLENPTEEEVANFKRLNRLISELKETASKVTDKSTKNSIISNMLEGSEKGKQMKESLHAIATSIRSELSESLKLLK